jgi:uncharacterized membrane protein
MAFLLTAIGAGLAVALELAEACAIVLAVGVSRRWRDAWIGAAAGAAACGLLAMIVGPVLLGGLAVDALRVVIGSLLILFGLEWLRKAILRLAGRKRRTSSLDEFEETEVELESIPLPPPGTPDWPARAIAFKGVLLEGVEIVLIVSVLAARPGGAAAALIGAAAAVLVTIAAAVLLRKPLARVPETELKWLVGVILTSFGVFFCGEGLRAGWPGGEAALLYCAVAIGASGLALIKLSARPGATG